MEVFQIDLIAEAENHGTFDGVLQFSDISGPFVFAEGAEGFGRESANIATGLAGITFEEESGEIRDVLRMFPEGSDAKFDDMQAIVEVVTKGSLLDGLFQVSICGRDDPDIDADGGSAADTIKGVSFKNAEELGLDGGSHLSHFIEEDGATVGLFELSDFSSDGTGERAFLVTEKFAFEEGLAERSAVHADEGAGPARAAEVHGACDEFLADTAFSSDEDSGIGGSDAGDAGLQFRHIGPVADQFAFEFELFAEVAVFMAGPFESVCEGFAALEVFQHERALIRDRQGVFEVLGAERRIELGGIEVNEAEDYVASPQGGANDAFDLEVADAVADAEFIGGLNIAGENGFIFREDEPGEGIGDPFVGGLIAGFIGCDGEPARIAFGVFQRKEQEGSDIGGDTGHESLEHDIGQPLGGGGISHVEGETIHAGEVPAGSISSDIAGGDFIASATLPVNDLGSDGGSGSEILLGQDRGRSLRTGSDRFGDFREREFEIEGEGNFRGANLQDASRQQLLVTRDGLTADEGAVSTSQIANVPFIPAEEDFAMIAAADLVAQDEPIGGGAADGHHLSGGQAIHIPPLVSLSNHKVWSH